LTPFRLTNRVSAVIQTASGVAAVVLGLAVIIGWHTGNSTLTQVRPGLAAMQYVNALAFVLAGIGLLSAAVGRDGAAGIAGLLTAAIGVLSLTQDILLVDPKVDFLFGVKEYLASGAAAPARMSPNAAICFGLIGLALFLRRAGGTARMSMATSLLGSTTAALGLVAVVGYASDLPTAYGWGRLAQMAVHTAAGLLVIGCGLVASGWRDSPVNGGAAHRIPVLVGVASLTATVAVWHALVVHDRQRTFLLIATEAAFLGSSIATPLEEQVLALERLAHRWSNAPAADGDRWTREAAIHLQQFTAYQSIERIDVIAGHHWRVPSRTDAIPAAARDHVLQTARARGTTFVTGALDLHADEAPSNDRESQVPSGSGFLIVVPLFESGSLDGAVIGAVRFDKLVEHALAGQQQGYETALFDGVRRVYGRTDAAPVSDEWMADVAVGVRDAPLRLRVWPTPSRLARLEGPMSSLILGGGLLLSTVLACMTFFAGTSRQRERQLRAAAQQLNELVAAREIANAEIARARDAALESDRLKSDFVANVSHELRTPMNGILGLTELLLDTDLTPEQREHAVTVRDCGEMLLALLNDILDLSKVAAGKLEIQNTPFEPRPLVQQVADLFTQRARAKGVDLVCLVQHDVPDGVMGDPGRVRQILMNLLGNAVKFTDRGEITVRVGCIDRAGDGVLLRVEVTDTGIGISPEAQAQLFQPFVQADGSITRKYGGSGLGLVISRKLAELMGGEMGMSSEPGVGSTFWFTIRTSAAAAMPAQPEEHHTLDGLRALVLEEPGNGRGELRSLLESWNISVVTEDTVDGAIRVMETAAARGARFDLLLVATRGVGSTVIDAAEALDAAGLSTSTRMILISGRGHRGDAQRAERCGAAAYLTQATGPKDLFACLSAVIAAGRNPRSSGPRLITRYMLATHDDPRPPLLVVEDNLVNQKVLVGLLAKLGYTAEVANNGIEALAALERCAYPIVFMDSQMPQMDGVATTAEIRRREGSERRTVIVAVTAHAMKGERERCLAAGMDDYLSKPVGLDALSAVIERWRSAASTAPPPALADPEAPEDTTLLDSGVLGQLRELETSMPGLLADVISTFLRETPGRIDRIVSALESSDKSAAEAASHGLKGSAAAIGATRLAALCAEIERHCRAGTTGHCSAPAAALTGEFTRVRELLVRDYLTPAGS
jgi:signal transduction histidine kinase/DNA-binding response OmpR family regulator